MKIAVRKTDGYILNSYMFNDGLEHDYEKEKHIFSAEEYEEYDFDKTISFEDKNWYSKHYYYQSGQIEVKYIPQLFQISEEINRLKKELNDTDYIIIKSYEANLLSLSSEYDILKVHADRQAIRDKINDLEQLFK